MSSLSSVGGASTASNLLSPTSSSSTGSTGTLSVGGLISGLNTSQIIQGLLAVQQQQITAVQSRESAVQGQETAYKALQAQLLGFQSAVAQLAQPTNGPFDGRTAASSNQAVLTAAASSGAAAGVYSLTVGSLAQANEIDSQGFASATGQITTGTLTVGSGGKSASITIDGTNNTLQGLAAAINTANVGVSATVINTGAAGQPYRLLLTATQTGTANAITLDTTGLGATNGGAARPAFGVADAVPGNGNQGTAVLTAGGAYSGAANDTFTFTVASVTGGGDLSGGGTVTLNYHNADSSQAGTFTLTGADLNQPHSVAEGINVRLGAGPLAQGDAFTVAATVATVQQAVDASVTLGSGSGALTVTSPTNTVNTAINGVTLNLLATTAPSQPVQVTVANDTTTAQTAVQNFVTAYNSVISTIGNDVSYDPSTNKAGVLLGDPSILNIENQLRDLVIQPVAGANPKLNSLSALGITSNASGQLQIDSTTLNNVLSGKVSGVTLGDVRNLFAVGGQSSNTSVAFANATGATKASATPYGVVVTQAALQAVLTAGTPLGANTTVTSGSNTFTLTVNGTTSNTIAVPPSTGPGYTRQALVAALQTAINADAKVGGQGVTVGLQNNALTLTTANYGQGATLGIGATSFLGFGGSRAAGQDVAGSFLVNGTSEPATGHGQLLTGNAGNANTDSLAVNVTLLPSQVSSTPTSSVASVTVTRGVAVQLASALNGLLDPNTGQLQVIDQNFQQQLSTYDDQVKQLQAQYNAKQTQLTTEFTNLETTLSNLKNTSSFLTSQVAALQSLQSGTSSKSGG